MTPFPRNEAELLKLVGDSLNVLSRKQLSHLLGVSISTQKRIEQEDDDHPKFVEMSPNRKGVIERHGRAYVLLRFAKMLYLEGKEVSWAIRVLRRVIHGQDLIGPPEAADAA